MKDFYKIWAPTSFNFGEPVVKEAKFSSKGLVGKDLFDFQKSAGAYVTEMMRKLAFKPGEIPLHLIAVGATETTGPNRNGDGFPKQACQEFHDTFVKFARFYRNHKNKDPKKSYGIVKHSWFNEEMGRIELIAALNGDEKTAAANGGLLADEELHMIAKGLDLPVSMACKVAFDICSGCGHKAKNRSEYCKEAQCSYGGLYDHIGEVFSDGHHLHAINTEPEFCDISKVGKQADHIALSLGVLEKVASGKMLSGAELAELLLDDIYKVAGQRSSWNDFAEKVAEVEKEAKKLIYGNTNLLHYFTTDSNDPVYKKAHSNRGPLPKQVVSVCADSGVIMDPQAYFMWKTCGNAEASTQKAAQVRKELPGIFEKLAKDTTLGEKLAKYNYDYVVEKIAEPHRNWAAQLTNHFGFTTEQLRRVRWEGALTPVEPSVLYKSAALAGITPPERVSTDAEEYALYKLATLRRICSNNNVFMLTTSAAILQNYI
jgi:hypothetical protein